MLAFIQGLFGLSPWTWFGINVVLTLLMVGWVYNDSRARQVSPYPWIAAMFFLSAPIGLIAYLFARPKGTRVKCWSCGRMKLERLVTCPWCGTKPSPEAEKAAAAAESQNFFSRIAKENFEAIVIAFAFALIIRCFFIEVFKIPSSSMEPTLLGDVTGSGGNHPLSRCPFPDQHVAVSGDGMAGGDRIMVTKYYYGLSRVDRYDVIVFKFPLNIAKNFIKRVVGLPNEHLMIKYGNIWTSQVPDGKFAIARKPLRIQDTLWIDMNHETEAYCPTHGVQDDDSCRECGRRVLSRPQQMLKDSAAFGKHWAVKDSDHAAFEVKDGLLRTIEQDGRKSILFSYTRSLIDYPGDADIGVDDLRLRFRFELAGREGAVVARIENRFGMFDVKLSASEVSQLSYTDATGRRQEIPLKMGKLETDRAHAFELFAYDGIVYVRLDGTVVVEHEYMKYHDEARALRWTDDSGRQSRVVQFGAQDGLVTFSDLALERDVHYKVRHDDTFNEGEAIKIPADSYLVLGDNTQFSHDSRAWKKIWYKLKDGRTIVAEKASTQSERQSELRNKYKDGEGQRPDVVIESDEHGNEVPIFSRDIVDSDESGKPFQFVGGEYIVGKALWIWWPLQRVGLIK